MTKVLLLLGVTGCGKTTVIQHLEAMDNRFVYIKPYTTRPLRENEIDKVHVSEEHLMELLRDQKLLAINTLYENKYGTPREPIEVALEQAKYPLIDFPIQFVGIMEEHFPERLVKIYLKPPGLENLSDRLRLRTDREKRLAFASQELEDFEKGRYRGLFDLVVVNNEEKQAETAKVVYSYFLQALTFPKPE